MTQAADPKNSAIDIFAIKVRYLIPTYSNTKNIKNDLTVSRKQIVSLAGLTQNVHYGEAVIESKSNEKATNCERPEIVCE